MKHSGTALLLLYEDSPSADRALARAEQIAASRGGDLVIVLTGDASTLPRLRERVERTRRSDVRVQIVALEDGATALRALVGQHDCGLLMIAHDSPLLAREPELLGELGYPILLAR